MDLTALHKLSASEAADLIRDGTISSEKEVDGQTFLDPDHAPAHARAADAWRSEGRAVGPLHGVPSGLRTYLTPPTCRRDYCSIMVGCAACV